MVNYGMLSAELSFSSSKVKIRINIGISGDYGRSDLVATADEVVVAKIEAVKAFYEALYYDHIMEVADGRLEHNCDAIAALLDKVVLSDYHRNVLDVEGRFQAAIDNKAIDLDGIS